MFDIGAQFRIPLFNNWLVEVDSIRKENGKIVDFILKFKEGALAEASFTCKIIGREQDNEPTASRRVHVEIVEGPAPIIGIKRWIDLEDFVR